MGSICPIFNFREGRLNFTPREQGASKKEVTCEMGHLEQFARRLLFGQVAAIPLGLQRAGTPQQLSKPSM